MKNPSMRNILLRAASIGLALSAAQAFAEPTFTVNSTSDDVDANPGDGACATSAGLCTLRAAIMEANRSSGVGATIVLPAGTYTLTIPATPTDGEDNGDLNLTAPASGNPVIRLIGEARRRRLSTPTKWIAFFLSAYLERARSVVSSSGMASWRRRTAVEFSTRAR